MTTPSIITDALIGRIWFKESQKTLRKSIDQRRLGQAAIDIIQRLIGGYNQGCFSH